MKEITPKARVAFAHTRRAISKINQRTIRSDFAEMLDGVEYCLAHRKRRVALKCAFALAAMAIGLNRTIFPRVSVGILHGILEDGRQDALFRPIVAEMIEKKDCECSFNNSSCVTKKGSTCYSIVGSGCGSHGVFSFPWTRRQ